MVKQGSTHPRGLSTINAAASSPKTSANHASACSRKWAEPWVSCRSISFVRMSWSAWLNRVKSSPTSLQRSHAWSSCCVSWLGLAMEVEREFGYRLWPSCGIRSGIFDFSMWTSSLQHALTHNPASPKKKDTRPFTLINVANTSTSVANENKCK